MDGSGYRFGAQIARGSTGEVWAAESIADGQRVAIKILDHELTADPAAVARFVQERQILTTVRSPHLVRVHDLVADAGTLAIVMDLIEGSDLRAFVRHYGTLSPALASELIGQILGALSVVHRAGIIHRDIKPENMLIDLSEPYQPRALLSDFSIAMIAGDPAENGNAGLAGTLPYLAPEVTRHGQASEASDLYATGVVLYELLAGRTPFEAPEPYELIRAHQVQAPPAIPGLHPALQSVLDQLLAKSPQQRPVSAVVARQLLAQAAAAAGSAPALPQMASTGGYQGPTIPPVTASVPVQAPEQEQGDHAVLAGAGMAGAGSAAAGTGMAGMAGSAGMTGSATGSPGANWWVARNAAPVHNTSSAFLFEPPVQQAPVQQAPAQHPLLHSPSGDLDLTTELGPDSGPPYPDTADRPTGSGPGLDAAGYAAQHGESLPRDHPALVTNSLFGEPRSYHEQRPLDVVPAPREVPVTSRRWRLLPAGLILLAALVIATLILLLGGKKAPERTDAGLPAALPQAPVSVAPVPVDTTPASSPSASPSPSASASVSPTPSASPSRSAKATAPAKPGATLITMPRLTGKSLSKANATLSRSGLGQASATRGCYGSKPPNQVITQSPKSGTRVKASAAVSVTVQDDCATVPNVVGVPLDQALGKLRSAGFSTVYRTGGRGVDNVAAAPVTGQFPAAGVSVPKTQAIVLQIQSVSSGGGGGPGGGGGG